MKAKKMMAQVFVFLLVIGLLAACNRDSGNQSPDNTPTTGASAAVGGDADASNAVEEPDDEVTGTAPVRGGMGGPTPEIPVGSDLPDTLANPNISIVYWYEQNAYQNNVSINPNYYNEILDAIPVFEEMYGGTVEYINVPWNDMIPRAVEMMSAGQAPDIILIFDRTFHNLALNGNLTPLNEYVNDNDYNIWGISKDLFTWKGEVYAIPNRPYPTLFAFNRDMLDMAGLGHPDVLFERGEWTFDKFMEIVLATTRYRDGEMITQGVGTWPGDGTARFMLANGTSLYNVDPTGGFATSNLTTAALQHTLDWMGTWASGPEPAWNPGNDTNNQFQNGNIAMVDTIGYFSEVFPFAYGLVPYPTGPFGPDKGLVTMPQAWAVPIGSQNVEGAVAFIRLSQQIFATEGLRREKLNFEQFISPSAWESIFGDPDTVTLYSYDKSTANIDRIFGEMINLMLDRVPAATIVERLEPMLVADLRQAFEGYGDGAVFEDE